MIALVCSVGMWADDGLYLVGDGTTIGWEGDVNQRQSTRMKEISSGVYVWTGLLKHGNEGFKIQEGTSSWDVRYCPSAENFAITQEGGSDTYQSKDDWKWNPTNENWQYYTITVDKNKGTLSWEAANPTFLVADKDGYLNIGTPEELNTLAFMCRCNVNNDDYKVRLTADIDYTAYNNGSLDAIGITEKYAPFRGDFDGQNYTITVDLETYSTRCGFFGTIQGKVHDLKLAGKITATNRNQTSGFCGLLKGNDSKIYNCISTVEIVDTQDGDGTIGGFCAVTYDASSIENCAFYGKISAPNREGNGGIVGWCNSGASTTIKNCLVVADINWKAGEEFGRNNPSVINSFKVNADDATLADGQMTYKLNNYVSGSTDWYQTLGADAMPTPLSTSKMLYANGSFYCDGVTSKGGDVVLSNVNESVVDPHAFGEDGICTGCSAVGQEAESAGDVYQLNNAGNLLWWAAFVNEGNPSSDAVLNVDVDLTNAKYVPAGTSANKYVGTFDGKGHAVTLKLDNPGLNYQGLFGVATDGATIQNVVVKGTITGNSYVAGIVGGSNGSEDGKKLNIFNCGNEATITSTNANGAGIIGVNMSGAAHFYIKNCYNVGDVTSARESGAITGWTGGDKSTIENTYNIGNITNGEGDGFIRGGGNLVNTFNLKKDDAKLASGELAAKLGEAFHQVIGTGYPVLDASLPNVYEIAVGDAGFATFVPKKNIEVIPAGVEAFAAQIGAHEVGSVYLAPVEELPADNAVIVKAAKGSYFCNSTESVRKIGITNDLTFSNEEETSDGSQYILAKPEGEEVGFYQATADTKIAARKGYLVITGEAVKAFYPFFGEDATAIANVNVNDNVNNAAIYNIAGQKLSKLQKGINIINGRKVLY